MILKYRHTDGSGKVYSGSSESELAQKLFCAVVFGELERPMERDERINSIDGSIEKIPQTQEQVDAEAKRKQILNLLTALDAGTASTLNAQRALAHLIRKVMG